LPPDEAGRLKALHRYEILDTGPELEFDDATLLASQICGAPRALVTFVDEKREWFKGKVGLGPSETARENSFGAWTILQHDVLVIADPQADERFADHPLVTGATGIRFYAGAPLVTSDGHAVGALCVMDEVPRELSLEQRAALRALSRQVVAQLESRCLFGELGGTKVKLKRTEEDLRSTTALFEAVVNSSNDGVLIVDGAARKILQNHRFGQMWKVPQEIAQEEDDVRQLQWVAGMAKDPGKFTERVRALYSSRDETSRDEIELKEGTILERYSSPVVGKDGQFHGRIWTFHDITERKMVEQALDRQQNELRVLFDLVPAMICFKDTKNNILRANKRYAEYFGMTVQNLEGKSVEDVYPQGASGFYQNDLEVIATGQPKFGAIASIPTREGKEIWIQTDLVPLVATDDTVNGIVVMVQDITERKMAEEALGRQRTELRALFDLVPAMICFKDTKNNIVRANKRFADRFGMTVEEVEGKSTDEVCPSVASDFYAQDLEVIQSRQAKIGVLSSLRSSAGEEKWFQTDMVPLCGMDEEVKGVVVMVQDITERKRKDEYVGRLAAIVDNSDDAIISKTLDGIVTSWNPAAERMFGHTASEINGQPLQWIIPADRMDEEAGILAGFARGEIIRHLETVRVRKDGRRLDVSATISPIKDFEGRIIGASKIVRDVTESKRVERALKTSEQRYRSLFESMTEGYAYCRILFDGEGRTADFVYLEVNQAFGSLTGLTNVVGRKVSEMIPGIRESNPELFETYGRVASTRNAEKYESFVERLGIWFSVSVSSPAKDHFIAVFDNITERKRAEAAVAFNEQRYRSLVEATTSMVWDTLASGQFEAEQPGWTAFTGQSFQQLRGWGWLDVIHPDDRAETRRLWLAALSSRSPYEIEHRLLAKDGTYRNMSGRAVPIIGGDGTILQWIGVHTDITERRRSEEALRLLSSAVLQSKESILITDAELNLPGPRIIFTNPAFTAMTGFSAEEAFGKTPRILQGPRTDKAVLSRLRHNLENDRVFQGEAINYRKDGTSYDQEWQVAPIHDPKGKTTHFVAIQRDISERKRLEARYRQLVESNVQGVLFWKRDGEITTANDAFLRLVHHTREDLEAGRINWQALTPAEYAHLDQKAMREIATDGVCGLYEKEYVLRDGTRVHILLASAAFADNPDEGVCFVVDLTERKALEARLYQSQKMETVGKLAGGVAHEFNSILTAIIGQSELLLGDLPAESSEAKSVIEIGKAAIRAANLTRQLLAYGRKQLLEPQTLDLNAVVGDMEGTLRHLLGQEVDLRLVPAAGLKAVRADAGQVEQVIMNIVLNAHEAMVNGGKVTLETANVSLGAGDADAYPEFKAGNYVMLAITDTGTGMSPDVKARIFEPFFSTKGVGEGTGLGLSTSYGIIKQSGGHISVYSEPARGTTFKIYLPQVDEPTKSVIQPLDTPELPRGTETILLAEDDPALRKMAATLLEKLGYRVLTASNGMEALSLKQKRDVGHIDLLFTDVVMPHMSGKELSERIQALYPHTKILFTSAFSENAFVHQGVLNRGVTLLQKPFTPSALARKLREVLDQ
jgi:PAS domain S-box-containing protein